MDGRDAAEAPGWQTGLGMITPQAHPVRVIRVFWRERLIGRQWAQNSKAPGRLQQ
jgi:hypothetical protein